MSDRSPNGEVAGLVEELRAEADQISAALPVFANLYRRAAGHIEIQTARLAGARKLADGYGIVLAMIPQGAPTRSGSLPGCWLNTTMKQKLWGS